MTPILIFLFNVCLIIVFVVECMLNMNEWEIEFKEHLSDSSLCHINVKGIYIYKYIYIYIYSHIYIYSISTANPSLDYILLL